MKPKLLIHACCAVCASAMVDLLKNTFRLYLFFYNPNIHPKEEYDKRKQSAIDLARIYNIDFFEGEYDNKGWFLLANGLEKEPEGGKRCSVCFKMRLLRTALFAEQNNILNFTTTLIQSHHKNEEEISKIGNIVSANMGIKYLDFNDFKIDKKEAGERARKLSKEYNLYHQKYCGCSFSLR